ncbi:MAG TPA: O-antigen ligase family protein [Clostridiaceae bacterium]|nr:O-antigen ligase family protein [Clostridiaceae bacterium]
MNNKNNSKEKSAYNKGSKELFFRIVCFLTAVIVYARDIFGLDINKFIIIGLALALALFSDIDHIFLYISFIVPIISGLPYSYIFIIFLSVLVIKRPGWIFNVKMIPLYIIIFIIEPLSIFYGSFSFVEYLRLLSVLIVSFAYIYNYSDEQSHIRACNLYLISFILAGLNIVIKTVNNASISYLLTYGIRLGDISAVTSVEGITVTYDPNTLAILSSISIAISLILLRNGSSPRWQHLLIIVFSVLIGMATLSRTFILLGVIILAFVTITSTRSVKGYISIFSFLGIIFVLFLCVNKYFPSLIRNITERFTTSDISNGRIAIFIGYMRIILNNPLKFILGLGIQNYQIKSGIYESCHNGTQEILVTWGLLGIIAVIIMFMNIFRRIKTGVLLRENKIGYLPFLLLIIGLQLIQFFSQYINIIVLLVTVSAAMTNKRHGVLLSDGTRS